MRFLRYNTATIVPVGPFYDKDDGVTIETALTITNENITLVAGLTTGNPPTLILDNIAGATSGTSNDLNYITGNDAGLMQLELAAADTNYIGSLFLTITDAANHAPVFHEFTVLPAVIFDTFVAGSDNFDVNVAQWLGTAAATPSVAGTPEVDMVAINGDIVAAANLKEGARAIITGSVDAAGTDEAINTDLPASGYNTDSALIGRVIIFDGNYTTALKGSAASIIGYTASTGVVTVASGALTGTPVHTPTADTFQIV